MKLIYAGVGLLASNGVKARPQGGSVPTITLEEQLGVFNPEANLDLQPLIEYENILEDDEVPEMELTPILIEEPEFILEEDSEMSLAESSGEAIEPETPAVLEPPKPQKYIEPSGNVVPLVLNPPKVIYDPSGGVLPVGKNPIKGYPTTDSLIPRKEANPYQIPLNGFLSLDTLTQPVSNPMPIRQVNQAYNQPLVYQPSKPIVYQPPMPVVESIPQPAYQPPRPAKSFSVGNFVPQPVENNPSVRKPFVWRGFDPRQNGQVPQKQPSGFSSIMPTKWQANSNAAGGSYSNPFFMSPVRKGANTPSYARNNRYFNFRWGQPKVAPADDETPVYGMEDSKPNKYWVYRCRCWKTCPSGYVWNYNKNRCSKDNLKEPWGSFFEENGKDPYGELEDY